MIKEFMRFALISLVLLLALASPALAEPIHGEGEFELIYGNISSPAFVFGNNDVTLIGINLQARYQLQDGLLIGALLPLAHGRFNEDAATSLGNATFSLSYRLSKAAQAESWLDTSLSLDLADNDGDGGLVATSFSLFWIPDPGRYRPNTNTVRVIYRHSIERGKTSFGFMGGIQYLVIDETNVDNSLRVPLQIQGAVALGPQVDAIAQFSTYWITGVEDDEDDFLHLFEAGLKLKQFGQGRLKALFYFPLDDSYRNVFEVWGIHLGFQTRI